MITPLAQHSPTAPTPTPQSEAAYVVVGLGDGQPSDYDAVLDFAAREAASRGISIKLVHGCGVGEHGDVSRGDQDRIVAGRRMVDLAARRLETLIEPSVQIFVTNTIASPLAALLEEAAGAQLLVLQRRDLSVLGRLFSASTTAAVAARADCPVVILHEDARPTDHAEVVVGIDDESRSAGAVRIAFDEARRRGVPVTAVHAWSVAADTTYGYVPVSQIEIDQVESAAAARLDAALVADRVRCPDVEVRPRLVMGSPVAALLVAAQRAGLVIIARHGGSDRGNRALGAKTRGLIDGARCPVIIAPPTLPS